MITETTSVVDTNGIGHAEPALGSRHRSIVRRIAAVGGVLYALGWILAARQPSALDAYEYALWAAVALAVFSVLSFRRVPGRRLEQSAWTQLLTAMVVPAMGGGLAVRCWQERWVLGWRSTLGYQMGWLAALVIALAVYVIFDRVERDALTAGGCS